MINDNDIDDVDGFGGDALPAKNTKIARLLSTILKIASVILGFVVISMLILAGVMFIPGLGEGFMADYVSEGGLDVGSTTGLGFAYLGTAIIAAAYFFVVRILSKVVKTLLAGDPFVPENISRLRSIWIIIAAAEILRTFLRVIATATGNDGDITLSISPGTWFLVFVIAALAEVFRHGAELRRDAELTV
ncbi:DUF2975 domain-containing protein [Fretibacter rubidus]|uniref:DUF2975 domain-containing protein n=1 Tax=Fretibacter rubidus TaxID=570162 RepID=UPI00352A1289